MSADPDASSSEARTTPPPTGEADAKRATKRPADPLAWSRLPLAVARRPLLPAVGLLACAIVGLLRVLLGSSADALMNLVSYVTFLGGSWAVLALVRGGPAGQLPDRPSTLAYTATALIIVVVSGIADVTLTVIGGTLVRAALALGPTVALAEKTWPHRSLWRGLLVIDEHPKAFAKITVISVAVALTFLLLVGLLASDLFGEAAGGELTKGASRGVASVIIGAIWMRFYLKVRSTLP